MPGGPWELAMSNSREVLTFQIEDITDETDIPFTTSPLEYDCMNQAAHRHSLNLLNRLSVREYAEAMGISESHLNNIMKSMTGYTPARLIHNETILEAKRLLIHSDLTVSEVGYHLNFEDPSYFSRFFKRETGLNPKQFRIGIREKYQLFKE